MRGLYKSRLKKKMYYCRDEFICINYDYILGIINDKNKKKRKKYID